MFSEHLKAVLMKLFFGSKRKKAITFSAVAIIFYLLHLKNKKSTTDNIKISKLTQAKDVEMLLGRLAKVMSIVFFGRGSNSLLKLSFRAGIAWRC